MDKYFALRKSKNETTFDDDLERQADEILRNYKYDDYANRSQIRDDLSETDTQYSYRRKNSNESMRSSLQVDLGGLRGANEDFDQVVPDFEKRHKVLTKALYEDELMHFDHENMTETVVKLKNTIVPEEKRAEIRQNVLTETIKIPANNYFDKEDEDVLCVDRDGDEKENQGPLLEKVVLNERDENRSNLRNIVEQENIQLALRKERADREREISAMELEDARSLKFEKFLHQQKFKDRLFTLPEAFQVYREVSSQLASLQNTITKSRFGMPKISKPISDPKKNLLEASKTEMDKLILNKVVNKKKNKLNFAKITEKDKVLLSKNKFDAELAKSGVLGQNKNIENIAARSSMSSLKKPLNQEYQKTLSDKSRRLSQTVEKNSISKWTLNKFLAINMKLTKMDLNEIKAAIKQNGSLPMDKLICTELFSGNQVADSENDPNLDIDDTKKSFESFVARFQQRNPRRLEIKMEDLEDIKNIGQLRDLQILKLSMNKIQEIRELNSVRMLIEVDLSQNSIKSIKGISNLKFLRNLNLEVNLISKMEDLDGCECLETLNLNNNHITRIEGLKSLKRLKKLFLFRNKITKIDGLEELQWLEEVDLGRNMIKEIDSVQKLPLLRKLVLYFNQIEKLPQNFSHISLSEIWLNGNKLGGISELCYFPSLKFLNLQENEISVLAKDSFLFAPNLKSLNLSFNKVESFGQLYKLLLHINSLQGLELNENPFLNGNAETLRAFYDNGLIALLPNLSELNSKPVSRHDLTTHDYANTTLKDSFSLYPGRLESNIHHIDKVTSNKLNRYGNAFYIQKHQINVKTHAGLSYLAKAVDSSSTAVQGKAYVMDNKYSHELVVSSYKYKHSLYKIKSLLVRIIYRKRKLKKHYQKNLSSIIKIQADWKGYKLRKVYNVKKIIAKRNKKAQFQALAKYALKIQKVFRGFRIRKRYAKYKREIAPVDDDELESVDLSFIDREPNYDDYTVKMPDYFSMHKMASTQPKQYIPQPPQQPNPKQIQSNQAHTKAGHMPSGAKPTVFKNRSESDSESEEEKHVEPKQEESYSVSSVRTGNSLQTIRLKETKAKAPKATPLITKEKKEAIVNDWGFQTDSAKASHELFLMKQLKRKNAPKKKEMNAEERLRKFHGK